MACGPRGSEKGYQPDGANNRNNPGPPEPKTNTKHAVFIPQKTYFFPKNITKPIYVLWNTHKTQEYIPKTSSQKRNVFQKWTIQSITIYPRKQHITTPEKHQRNTDIPPRTNNTKHIYWFQKTNKKHIYLPPRKAKQNTDI